MGHRVVEIKTRCESGRIGNLLKSNTFGFFHIPPNLVVGSRRSS